MIWAVQSSEDGLITRNLRVAMSSYSRSTAKGAALDLGAAGAFSSGVDYPVFNAMVLSENISCAKLATLLDRCEEFYRRLGVGWSCWLDESMVATEGGQQAARLLEGRSMRWVAEHDGMLSGRIRPSRRRLAGLPTRPVACQRTRDDFVSVCGQVFLLPDDITRLIYGSAGFWDGPMRGWVGYDGERPVCIAVSAADDRSIGLYSVATMPGHRKRGYGEFITRHAVGEAAERSGLDRWSLQSTPAGLELYRRLGYEARTRITVWATE
jgi:ribosomal protein S18 acetylase RimI-like enzyme